MIRVAFFGTHTLGSRCLRLLDRHPDVEIALVVTYGPDADPWWDEPVWKSAVERGYHVEAVENEREILEYDIDYLLSVYYPNVLGADLLDHPSEAALNLHQAELPRYRGSNVFAHAIMNAREDDHWRYGTTFHEMVEEVDAGAIVDREFVEIRSDDTAGRLYERTREASLRLFNRSIPKLVERTVLDEATPQDEFDGTRYFYTKESLNGEMEVSAADLAASDEGVRLAAYDKIRALEFPPFDPAYTTIDGEKVFLTTRPR